MNKMKPRNPTSREENAGRFFIALTVASQHKNEYSFSVGAIYFPNMEGV